MPSTSRRTFLKHLALVAAAPFAAKALARQESASLPTSTLTPPIAVCGGYQNVPFRAEGLLIKVPSNRVAIAPTSSTMPKHAYIGDWDGTFKEERGCSNPAYVLADLYERTGEEPDWVVADKSVPASIAGGPMIMTGMMQLLKPRLNWQMFYDWGVWADKMVSDLTPEAITTLRNTGRSCCEVNRPCCNREQMISLRKDLRMDFLCWQGTDSRYRTSYPVTAATSRDSTY